MKTSEIRAKVEEAKRKKQRLDLEKQEKEKKNLFGKIAENRQSMVIQQQRNLASERRKKMLVWLSALGTAASFIVVSSIYMCSFFMNMGKYTCTGEKNADGNGVIPEESHDYQELDRFFKGIISERSSHAGLKKLPVKPEDIESGKEMEKVLESIEGDEYKISYVQADRNENCYHVMCEFSNKGCYYFTVAKQADDLRLVSVVDFF